MALSTWELMEPNRKSPCSACKKHDALPLLSSNRIACLDYKMRQTMSEEKVQTTLLEILFKIISEMERGWSYHGYLRSEHFLPRAYFVNNSYLVFSYFGSYGVCSRKKFDKNFYEKYHLIHNSVCTSCILMVGLIIGTFNEQH